MNCPVENIKVGDLIQTNKDGIKKIIQIKIIENPPRSFLFLKGWLQLMFEGGGSVCYKPNFIVEKSS